MKRVFKVFSVIAALIAAAPLFAGGKQDSSSGNGVETIRVWSDNAHEATLRNKQIEAFNNGIGKEKGIKIDYQLYGSNYWDVIKVAAQSGDAPDLYRPQIPVQDFLDAGYIIPLTDIPGSAELLKKYEGALIGNKQVFSGKIMTLPYNLTTRKFVINQDLFDKNGIKDIPRTWDDVHKYAKLISDNGGGKEFGFIFTFQSDWVSYAYATYMAAPSVGHSGFDNINLKFDFEGMTPVFEIFKQMFNDGSAIPGGAGMDADQIRAVFAEGRIGMIPAASFDVAVYNNQFPAKCNWKMIDIPVLDARAPKNREFVDDMNLLVVGSSAKKHLEKAFEVFKFFYSDENAAEMYEEGLYIPFRQEAIKMAKKTPDVKGFADSAYTFQPVIRLPMPDTITPFEGEAYRPLILNIFSGPASTNVRAMLQDLDKRYNAGLAKLPAAKLEEFRAPANWARDLKAK
ncbi:sugar ABC transporter substrate-binding protein [Spirochaetia bacterium]|nr:sugar ABC transporter substrate-binding protein [Spirochaetia bacterium]